MKTDVIIVSSKGKQMETALQQAEKVAAYKGLSTKSTLHLRLLAEEMLSMMRSITGEPEGEFWIEDNNGEYQLHLKVATRLSIEKREQLLSVSATGKNESARGLMGRIRAFFDWGCDEDYDGFAGPYMLPDAFEHSTSPALDWEWSMRRYEDVLSARVEQKEPLALGVGEHRERSAQAVDRRLCAVARQIDRDPLEVRFGGKRRG